MKMVYFLRYVITKSNFWEKAVATYNDLHAVLRANLENTFFS